MRHVVHEPEPTIWPVTLALGVTLAAAGVVTSWIFVVVGALVAAAAIVAWIREMIAEQEAGH